MHWEGLTESLGFQLGEVGGFTDLAGTAGEVVGGAGGAPGGLGSEVEVAVAVDFGGDAVDGVGQMCLVQFAFPDDDDRPSMGLQLPPDLLVPRLVARDLRRPEFRVRLGHRVLVAAFVPMPETPMDKHHRPIARKHDVGGAGQPPVIHPIPEPLPPQRVPEPDFRLRIGGVDGGHVRMALLGCDGVGHSIFLTNLRAFLF